MNALVSVIVPCYQHAQFLPDALQSVLEQSYPLWECIIVNDGSRDNTREVAKDWCVRDNRFKYLEKENGGLSSARNAGIKLSKGKYILPLDADDKIGTDYLKLAVEAFGRDDEIHLVYCEAAYFGDKEGKWDLPSYSLKKLALKNIIFCSAVFKRKDFDVYGPFDPTFEIGREDWDFWLSLLSEGGKVVKLKETLFFYRKKSEGSMIDFMNDSRNQRETALKIFNKHRDLYLRLFGDPITMYNELERLKVRSQIMEQTLEKVRNSRTFRFFNFLKRKFYIFKNK